MIWGFPLRCNVLHIFNLNFHWASYLWPLHAAISPLNYEGGARNLDFIIFISPFPPAFLLAGLAAPLLPLLLFIVGVLPFSILFYISGLLEPRANCLPSPPSPVPSGPTKIAFCINKTSELKGIPILFQANIYCVCPKPESIKSKLVGSESSSPAPDPYIGTYFKVNFNKENIPYPLKRKGREYSCCSASKPPTQEGRLSFVTAYLARLWGNNYLSLAARKQKKLLVGCFDRNGEEREDLR